MESITRFCLCLNVWIRDTTGDFDVMFSFVLKYPSHYLWFICHVLSNEFKWLLHFRVSMAGDPSLAFTSSVETDILRCHRGAVSKNNMQLRIWPGEDSWINISGTGSILKSVTAYAESLGDCCEIGSQWRCVLKMECFFAVQNKWDSILWHCRRVWECLNILRWNTYRNFVRKLKLIWINHNYSSI